MKDIGPIERYYRENQIQLPAGAIMTQAQCDEYVDRKETIDKAVKRLDDIKLDPQIPRCMRDEIAEIADMLKGVR